MRSQTSEVEEQKTSEVEMGLPSQNQGGTTPPPQQQDHAITHRSCTKKSLMLFGGASVLTTMAVAAGANAAFIRENQHAVGPDGKVTYIPQGTEPFVGINRTPHLPYNNVTKETTSFPIVNGQTVVFSGKVKTQNSSHTIGTLTTTLLDKDGTTKSECAVGFAASKDNFEFTKSNLQLPECNTRKKNPREFQSTLPEMDPTNSEKQHLRKTEPGATKPTNVKKSVNKFPI